MFFNMDIYTIFRRLFKYLAEGVMVALAAYFIPNKTIEFHDIILVGLTAAATFSMLDMYAPSVAKTVRPGAGFGIGANLVNFPGLMAQRFI